MPIPIARANGSDSRGFPSYEDSARVRSRKMAAANRKKVDNRIRVLIENGVTLRHRSFFVIVGDKGRDQVSCMTGIGCIAPSSLPACKVGSSSVSGTMPCEYGALATRISLYFGIVRIAVFGCIL